MAWYVISGLGGYLLCFVTALAGVAAEADADARPGEALARALEADEEERVRLPALTTPPGSRARMWTVTATAEMAGLNVLTYLTAYFDAGGRSGGKPSRARTWNDSYPGTQHPKICTPGQSHPPHR